MSKPKVVSSENKAIARLAAQAFGGTPHVYEYEHDSVDLSIGILSCEGRPSKGITSYATVRLSDFPMQYSKGEFPTRLELVGACASAEVKFANVLAAAAFCVMRTGLLIAPGSILRNYVAEYFPECPVPHLYFTAPFLWESSLKTTRFDTKQVSWLLAMPISDAEASYRREKGDTSLEALFERNQIDIFDLKRVSVV